MNGINHNVIRKINKLAIPGILSMLLSTIFTIADEAIIGRIDVDGYTAVSISANIIYQVIGNLGSISIAFSILFAKSVGKKDDESGEKIFNTVISLSVVIGLLAEVLAVVFGKALLNAIYGIKNGILDEAYSYLVVAGLRILINLICFVMSAFFKNMLEPRIALIATVVALPVNFIIDYTLVFGKFGFPKLRGTGAAIGTVCGLIIEIIIYVISFVRKSRFKYHFKIDGAVFKEVFNLFVPLLGQDFVENTIFVLVVGGIISRYSTVLYATYAVINTIIIALTTIMYAYAGANQTLVGQAFSSKEERNKCLLYPKYSVLLAVLAYMVILTVTIIFPDKVCGIITDQYEILEKATPVVVFALVMQILNIPCQIYKYALQSVGYERWTLIASVLMTLVCCGMIFMSIFVIKGGLFGVFAAIGIFYCALSILFIVKYTKETK